MYTGCIKGIYYDGFTYEKSLIGILTVCQSVESARIIEALKLPPPYMEVRGTCLIGCFRAYFPLGVYGVFRVFRVFRGVFRGVLGVCMVVYTCITGVHRCIYGNKGV